jgi:hypothetical protein
MRFRVKTLGWFGINFGARDSGCSPGGRGSSPAQLIRNNLTAGQRSLPLDASFARITWWQIPGYKNSSNRPAELKNRSAKPKSNQILAALCA